MLHGLLLATVDEPTNHMTVLDWVVTAAWVLGTSFFGFCFAKYVKTANDYLVAGRKLKWWQIGIAQAADSVDAGDFIAIAGMAYLMGFTALGYIWVGMAFATYILARYLAPMLYRSGVVTNAEFLALRFTPSMRIASAVVQVFYRFIAMALVGYAMAKMFQVVVGIDFQAGIFVCMCITIFYVFAAGQLGVVMAAVPQVILMLVVSGIIFFSVFSDIGGLSGFIENKSEYGDMLHMTYHTADGLNSTVFLIGLILPLFAYPIVNQTVAQRIVSAYSESDARKGSIVSLLPWFIVTGVAILAGVIGTVLVPGLTEDTRSELYPTYMTMYLSPGILGLGVAALVVGSMSTGAGIGTAISGLMTNDIFRILDNDKYTEKQKLFWTRTFATAAIVLGSSLALAVDKFDGMIPFYTAFTGTFVLPLTVPYLAAAFCPWASRGSALASLIGGCLLGLVLFIPTLFPEGAAPYELKWYMTQPQCRPFWVLGAATLLLIVWSLIENSMKGRIPKTQLAGRMNAFDFGRQMPPEEIERMMTSGEIEHWSAEDHVEFDKLGLRSDTPWYARPGFYEILTVIAMIALMIWLW